MVPFQLVHSSVQVPTWWWFKSSRGLIGTEGICIGFSEIVSFIGHDKVNPFVVYTTLDFSPVFAYQSSIQIKFWKDFSIGNHILSALSPAVSPPKVEIIYPVQLLVILVIYSSNNFLFAAIKVTSFIVISVYT